MIDTHTHLYVDAFENDLDDVMKRAEYAGVKKMYLPAIDSSTHEAMLRVEARYPAQCFAMIGLHPCSVKADYQEELAIIETHLQQRRFAAIGETGLDFYWDTSFVEAQTLALEQQIQWAVQYNLPLVLHTRNATPETIAIIEKYKQPALRGIFHCFGGTLQEAQQIIACNFLLGIGGVVTYKNGGLDSVLPAVELQHLVLETDAPYLAPVPYRGKRNECSYLPSIAQKIADIKQVDVELVYEQTTLNAEKIFGGG
jgi:TatD DNase family protein